MLQKFCVCSLLLDNGGQFKSSFRTSCNDLATKPDWKRGNAGSTVGILFITIKIKSFYSFTILQNVFKRRVVPLLLKYKSWQTLFLMSSNSVARKFHLVLYMTFLKSI